MAAATVSPNSPTFQPRFTTAEGVCARCNHFVTDGPLCPRCIQLVRLEADYEQSLERRSDCDGGEI